MKKIKNVEKVADRTYLITSYEEPLRQQIDDKDQRIKELEEEIERLKKNWRISKTQQQIAFNKLKRENKQNGIISYPFKILGCKIDNEEQLLDFAKDSAMTEDYLNEKISNLKQQLHELPKKICREIINHIKPLRDLEITAIRESREYDFINEKARLNWIGTRKEISQNYNDLMKFVGEIQAKYKEK